tara:strand:+ start:517 stop:1578 length:1062 start_codon:yes stop_codon:yes gene_type:complete
MIAIIGAGPVGNFAAESLAKKNEDVFVFEEHKKIGEPVQCTGIVTQEIKKVVKIKKDVIVNKVKKAKIFSPNGKHIDVKLTKPNLILDRAKFDQDLAEQAKKAGAKFVFGAKYRGREGKKIIVGQKKYLVDALVGADGPNSCVARTNQMFGKRKFVVGTQARVKTKFDYDQVEFWLGFGEFGWLVPESKSIARVGVVAYKHPTMHLNNLLKHLNRKYKVLSRQGGLIPLYNPNQRMQKKDTYLVGDAATHVKATTFGGLVPGLLAAKELGTNMKSYENKVKKNLGRDLRLNLLIRKMMDRFNEKDYNDLISMFTRDKVREIIETHDRDFPTKFMLKLLLREPRLTKFSKRLIF